MKNMYKKHSKRKLQFLVLDTYSTRCQDIIAQLKLENIFRTKYIPVVAPKNNERIKRQNGAFLLLGIDIEKPDYFLKNTFNLKDQLIKDFGDGIPRSLVIPQEHKQSILKELDIIGINEAFVYPELEHQTSYIKSKHHIKVGE